MLKKIFKDNPTLQLIPFAEEDQVEPVQGKSVDPPQKGYKANPIYLETKSRRLQLVLQPSLYERVKRAATDNKLSVNEYIHQILDRATMEEQ